MWDEGTNSSRQGVTGGARRRALFFTYQRTTFIDSFRSACRLQQNGTYEPIFLIAAGTAKLLEREIEECRRRGIGVLLEDEVYAAARPKPIERQAEAETPGEVVSEPAAVSSEPAAVAGVSVESAASTQAPVTTAADNKPVSVGAPALAATPGSVDSEPVESAAPAIDNGADRALAGDAPPLSPEGIAGPAPGAGMAAPPAVDASAAPRPMWKQVLRPVALPMVLLVQRRINAPAKRLGARAKNFARRVVNAIHWRAVRLNNRRRRLIQGGRDHAKAQVVNVLRRARNWNRHQVHRASFAGHKIGASARRQIVRVQKGWSIVRAGEWPPWLGNVLRWVRSDRIWWIPIPASVPSAIIIPVCRLAVRAIGRSDRRGKRQPGYLYAIRRLTWYPPFQFMLRTELRYARVLRAVEPDIICMAEDIPGPLTGPLIRIARQMKIPTVILPFTIPNPLEAAEYAITNPETQVRTLHDWMTIAAYPRWSIVHKGRRLLRLPPRFIFASEYAGIAPPDPWVPNSGFADRIAVESERMFGIYRKLGFPPEQLVVTGSGADDMLHDAMRDRSQRRDALYRELGLPAGKPMLLSALVPDQLVSGVPYCEFDRYADIVEFWVKTIATAAPKFNVVVKINPRDRREDFLHLEKWGVVVAPHDTIDLVPLADIYVASISSTLRWAAACGIPGVNYDVYHFAYGDYAGAPGIVHADTKEEFSSIITRLATDESYLAELRARQEGDASRWGCLDGRSTERLVNLFDDLRRKAQAGDGRPKPRGARLRYGI